MPIPRRSLIAVLAVILALGLAPTDQRTAAAAPSPGPATPVYDSNAADPGVVQTSGRDFYAFTTGALTRVRHGESARGPWRDRGAGLTHRPAWSVADGMWAPDAIHVSGDRWVLYYAARVNGLEANQRCIGTAVSTTGPAGPYDPGELPPLSCPAGATWPDGVTPLVASDQPVLDHNNGFIDPVPFQASDGRRYVIYKKQKPPLTILRIVEVEQDWLTPVGPSKIIATRTDGQMENAVMVERDGRFYLFVSWDQWWNCTYRTVWAVADSPTATYTFPDGFPDTPSTEGGTLMTSADNGVCGPGGADMVVNHGAGGDAADTVLQMFFHGWVCDRTTLRACTDEEARGGVPKFRALYAGLVGWRDDGTPFIVRYDKPRS